MSESNSIQVATILLEMGILTLPLWLAALRYILKEVQEEDTSKQTLIQYSLALVLGYVTLLAAVVSGGTYLQSKVANDVQVGLAFLQGFAVLVGAGAVSRLIDKLPDNQWNQVLRYVTYSFMVIFLLLVFNAFAATLTG